MKESKLRNNYAQIVMVGIPVIHQCRKVFDPCYTGGAKAKSGVLQCTTATDSVTSKFCVQRTAITVAKYYNNTV